jgi:hypothetical protein
MKQIDEQFKKYEADPKNRPYDDLVLDVMQKWNAEVNLRRRNGEYYWPGTKTKITPKVVGYFFKKLQGIPGDKLSSWFVEAEKGDFNKIFWARVKSYRAKMK